MNPIVFDTTCVSHFARAGRLDVLDVVTNGRDRIIPNEVAADRLSAESLVDELPSTDMRLPADGAGFFAWSYTEGLLP